MASVTGGFHLIRAEEYQTRMTLEKIENMKIEKILVNHCTGIEKYALMKSVFGDKVRYFCTGESIKI